MSRINIIDSRYCFAKIIVEINNGSDMDKTYLLLKILKKVLVRAPI